MKVGLEVLLEDRYSEYSGARIGLITNPSGIDQQLRSAIDLIHHHPKLDLRVLFGPEHGVRGNIQAGVKVQDAVDEKTGLPMKSLYGENKRLQREMLEDVDLIIYDMQDVGARFYTLIYTLAYALEGVKAAGKKIVVLDRPNPIAFLGVDGNIIDEKFSSFVGGYGLPILHGMTVGELALYFNEEFGIHADLDVIQMEGWHREMCYDQTGLSWVYPSPNIPTLDTATLYPGTCLFEGTNLSEGRGTTKPFELIGAPWINAREWSQTLNQLNLPGVGFRPVYFTPVFSKHEGEQVEGVQVHIFDRNQVNPLQVGIEMLRTAFQMYPECEWFTFKEHYFIDKLAGGDTLRKVISDGRGTVKSVVSESELYVELKREWAEGLALFEQIREKYLLYR